MHGKKNVDDDGERQLAGFRSVRYLYVCRVFSRHESRGRIWLTFDQGRGPGRM